MGIAIDNAHFKQYIYANILTLVIVSIQQKTLNKSKQSFLKTCFVIKILKAYSKFLYLIKK